MIALLWRRAALARLLVAVVALALGGASVLGTQLAAAALQQQARRAAGEASGRAQFDISPFRRPGFTAAEARAVARLKPVAEEGLLTSKADLAHLPNGSFRQVVLVVVYGTGVALRPLPVTAGRRPASTSEVAVSQALSPGFSAATGRASPGAVGPGARLRLTGSKGVGSFRVVGVVSDFGPGAPFTADAVYLTAATAHALFASGLRISDLAVRLRPGATLSQLERQLPSALHQDFTVAAATGQAQNPIAELSPVLDAVTALSLLLAVALVAATLSAVVLERRREIGLARLAGASRTLVFRSFLREALALGVVGGLLGVGGGYLLAVVLVAMSASATSQPSRGIHFEWTWTVGSLALVVAVALLGAMAPALEAATVRPLEAVRPRARRRGRGWAPAWPLSALLFALGASIAFSAGGGPGVALGAFLTYSSVCCLLGWQGARMVGWAGSLVGALLAAPVAAVATRARTRPGRTALALGSLFVTVATAAGLAGITSSALLSGRVWVGHLFVGNYLVVGPVAQSPKVESELLAAIRSGPGHPRLSHVAPVRFIPARVGHLAVTLAATSPAAYRNTGALQFTSGDRAGALGEVSSGRGVILPLQVASALGVDPGARVRLVTGGGTATFTVAGVVAHTLPGPAGVESVIVSSRAAARHFGAEATGFDLLQLGVRGPAAGRAVRLAAFRYGMESETTAQVSQGVRRGIEHAIDLLAAVALVGVVIAVLAAINTVVLDTREATRELALLRVVGLGRSALRRAVVGEAAATALLGTVLGVGAGVGLVYPEVAAASTPALPLPFAVSWAAVGSVLGAAVAALVLAALLPARQLGEMDPTAALSLE